MFAWFIQQRSTGTPISGPFSPQEERCVTRLKTAARETKHRAADREFNASSDWLEKFKTRHGIRNLSIQDEKLSADEETVEPFLQKLHEVIGKESDPQTNLQCRRDCTFLEVLTSKNSLVREHM